MAAVSGGAWVVPSAAASGGAWVVPSPGASAPPSARASRARQSSSRAVGTRSAGGSGPEWRRAELRRSKAGRAPAARRPRELQWAGKRHCSWGRSPHRPCPHRGGRGAERRRLQGRRRLPAAVRRRPLVDRWAACRGVARRGRSSCRARLQARARASQGHGPAHRVDLGSVGLLSWRPHYPPSRKCRAGPIDSFRAGCGTPARRSRPSRSSGRACTRRAPGC